MWRQGQTGIRQIQEQPVYKQILERMCRDVPFDVPNPMVVVAGEEQEEQTVQGGQEHRYSLTGVSYCHCHKEGSGIAVRQSLITMFLCYFLNWAIKYVRRSLKPKIWNAFSMTSHPLQNVKHLFSYFCLVPL